MPLINVNFPAEAPRGTMWTRQSMRHYDGKVVPGKDPMGRTHYWFTVVPVEATEEGTDRWAIEQRYVSMTPLRLELTDEHKLAQAKKELDVPARVAVLSNAWAAVRAGKLKPASMLKVLPLFDDDSARQVVEQVVAILSSMSVVLIEDEARPAFRKLVAARLAKRKKDLGWVPKKDEAGGTGDESIMRRSVLWAMGELAEDDATLREAEEHASKWLADPSSVDNDTAAVALDLASRKAGEGRLAQLG